MVPKRQYTSQKSDITYHTAKKLEHNNHDKEWCKPCN